MRVPYSWLQELVPLALPVNEVADRLTMAGFEVEEMEQLGDDTVMEVHVNANRGDALSLVGIAREVAALTGNHVNHPVIAVQKSGPDIHSLTRVSVEAPDLCPRYTARVVQGVKIGPSPEWVQQRLTAVGIRPINNVVDATNYVMMELGQPLHAFDLERLESQTIVVRRARPEEPFMTLDGIERVLSETMLVIADAGRAVALAGIMGGENSEVTGATTSLLLESAHFDRTSVRKTARANTLSTESSYRFERVVDPGGTVRAVDRLAQLIVEWSGGTIATGLIDVAAPLALSRIITLSITRVNAVLGTSIPRETIIASLQGLELPTRKEDEDLLQVTVPSFRPDLLEEMDLIEEVARIYGYQRIPTTVPAGITGAARQAPEMAFEDRVRELLASAGLFETISYSLIDYRVLDEMQLPSGAPERAQIVALRNPKSEEFTHLRPTLLVSLLEYLRENARRSIEDVQVFEMGRIFRTTGGGLRFNYAPIADIRQDVRVQSAEILPLEQRAAGIAIMGRPWTSRWGGGDSEVDFFWLKGLLEQLLADMAVSAVEFAAIEHPALHPGRTAQIRAGECVLGIVGEVHPRVAENFDLPRRAILAEINVDALMDAAGTVRPLPSLSRFPAVERDIAFLVKRLQPAAAIRSIIAAVAGSLCEAVELFDVYTGANIPSDSRSLAYRLTFRAAERTLSDEEVDAAMTLVRQALIDEVAATLR